jgi:hypothetical protein
MKTFFNSVTVFGEKNKSIFLVIDKGGGEEDDEEVPKFVHG